MIENYINQNKKNLNLHQVIIQNHSSFDPFNKKDHLKMNCQFIKKIILLNKKIFC